MKIRKASVLDVPVIVRIHLLAFPRGIMSFFGDVYLIKMYELLVSASQVGLVVEDSEGVVNGYIFSEADISKRDFMSLKILCSIMLNISKRSFVFMPIVISRIYLLLKVRFRPARKLPLSNSLELAYIAIDSEHRSQGIGRVLIQAFETTAKKEGYRYLLTRTHNSRLTNFYVNNKGAEILYEINTWKDYTCVLNWNLN